MEDFIVSARKYRPQDFDSVVGQENITQTLLKAIENNHLAQAFLFCGPRGVGKTTCARILARTVNAHSMGDTNPDTDFSFNIFELDAASNNSVDDIRSLIDQVRIPPQIGKYKVYIIDEVHMLSTNAFNAFLKTLEEPPAYAIFILATTEKHKVLPTIISRCQVFDFNRIQVADIVNHLAKIAEKEGIDAEHDALHIIAEKADGALRDALSIFDQIVGFAGNKLTYRDVITNLNILDYDYYFDATDSFLNDDKAGVLVTFNTILNNGFDGHNFLNGLANHFRNLLFCTSERTASIMEVGTTIKERYVQQAQKCDSRFLLNSLATLSDTDIHYKSSKNPRLLVELCLLKLCNLAEKFGEKKNSDSEIDSFDNHFDSNATVEANRTPSGNESSRSTADLKKTGSTNESSGEPLEKTPTKGKSDSSRVISNEPEQVYVNEPHKESGSIQATPVADKEVVQPETADESENKSEQNTVQPIPESTEVNKASISNSKSDEPPLPKKSGFSSKLGKGKLKGLTSLSSMQTQVQEETVLQPESSAGESIGAILHENRPKADFNLAELWAAWDEYAALMKEEDKQSYYSTLTKHKPVMREKFKIELLVDNHIQKSDLDDDKGRLLGHLREKLNNWHIQLEGVIDEEESTDGDSLYDPYKKYEAMIEKNPTLAKMKHLFDLDVDYDG